MKQMHKLLSRLGPSLGMRLPEIVRSNALGIVTNAEQIGHYSNYRHLSGVALYYEPSFFNHSCTPNCSRYHLGDWTIIRTNQEVKQGEELCISYIEHEFLFEPLAVRQTILDEQRKDFRLDIAIDDGELMDRCDVDKDAATSELGIRRVTMEIKAELMSVNAEQRITEIESIFQDRDLIATFIQSDIKELNFLKGITFNQLGKPNAAKKIWKGLLDRTKQELPPNDESLITYAIQLAISDLAVGDESSAHIHLSDAMRVHTITFGGDAFWFCLRYRKELLEPGIFLHESLVPFSRRLWGIAASATEAFRCYA